MLWSIFHWIFFKNAPTPENEILNPSTTRTSKLIFFVLFYTAIIGGGIGGTSCAYFLRQMFEDSIKIDLYEGGEVGGRLSTVKMNNGFEYETGGAIIHNRNKYMNEFADTFREFSMW